MAEEQIKLTAKQIAFCENYVIDFNGSQSAIRAGYSENSAKEIASDLLTLPNIQKKISALKKKLSDKNEGLAQKIIDELKKVGFSNIVDYLEEANSIADLTTLTRVKTAAVASVKKTVTVFGDEDNGGTKTTVELKLCDKINALEKLGRHVGLFEADNTQKKPIITVNVSDE